MIYFCYYYSYKMQKTVYIIIPVMDEADYLPHTLSCAMGDNVEANVQISICVNQPDDWWHLPDKKDVCIANMQTIAYIKSTYGNKVHVLDYASPDKGWKGKKQGVGCARRVLMQRVLSEAKADDVIVSMDADTCWQKGYLQYVVQHLQGKSGALCAPYYHQLSGMEAQDRAMLRYEIYMRTYLINLLRIGSPYAFTALGSVITCKASAAKAVGGFDTQMSGEDFYFLQKLAKSKPVSLYSPYAVYPANRVSDRVPYGTGPAIVKNMQAQWDTYPVFAPESFDKIKQTYLLIPQLYEQDMDSDYFCFLKEMFKNQHFLQALRKNSRTVNQFSKLFHQKADALREFQYLRYYHAKHFRSSEENLRTLLEQYYPSADEFTCFDADSDMSTMPLQSLNALRNRLYDIEISLRKNHDIEHQYI